MKQDNSGCPKRVWYSDPQIAVLESTDSRGLIEALTVELRKEREIIMRNLRKKKAKDWVRMAAKLSLLFTEPKVRAAMGDRIKDTVDDLSDTVSDKYDDLTDSVSGKYDGAVDRLEAAA